MPTSLYQLRGVWTVCPQTGGLLASGAISAQAPLCEQVTLDGFSPGSYDLTTDDAVVVGFGGITNANVVHVNSDRPITVILTSAAGVAQSIAIDDTLALLSRTNPYTAISIQRQPATEAHVEIFLGEMA